MKTYKTDAKGNLTKINVFVFLIDFLFYFLCFVVTFSLEPLFIDAKVSPCFLVLFEQFWRRYIKAFFLLVHFKDRKLFE